MIQLQLFQAAACPRNIFPPNWYDGLQCNVDPATGGTTVGLASAQDIIIVIANLVRIVTALAGAAAVIFLIVGGIFYVISQGDPGRIKRAKEIINQAITGLVIVLLSYSIVTFIAGRF